MTLDGGVVRDVAVGDVIRYTVPPNKYYPRTQPKVISGRVWLVTEARVFFRCSPPCRGCTPNRYDIGDHPSHGAWRTWTNWERI